MTTPTPYTDDDVMAVQEAAICGPTQARRLLDAGYRKPEPDTPPEPQERYRVSRVADQGEMYVLVDDGPDPGPHSGATVGERGVTDRAARLLNLDAKYEDQGGVAGVIESVDNEARDARLAAKLQSERASTAEAEAEKQQRRAEDFKAHLKERVNQRDEARDEVERLTSHVEHWKNEAEYTQERVDKLLAEVGQLRLRADAFQAKFEEQCQQGDDMFISHYKAIKRAVTAEAELGRLQDKASARAVKAAELALEDARAELIREREDRGLERDLFAARVKELEAERLGATTNQPVTAEMVRRVLGESGTLAVAADQGLSPFDVADRLNGLLGRTPHRPEDR